MFVFLVCRLLHRFAQRLGPGSQRLSAVKALRGNFTGVIDSHQAGDMRMGACVQFALGNVFCRVAPRIRCGTDITGIQTVLQFVEQTIAKIQFAHF